MFFGSFESMSQNRQVVKVYTCLMMSIETDARRRHLCVRFETCLFHRIRLNVRFSPQIFAQCFIHSHFLCWHWISVFRSLSFSRIIGLISNWALNIFNRISRQLLVQTKSQTKIETLKEIFTVEDVIVFTIEFRIKAKFQCMNVWRNI